MSASQRSPTFEDPAAFRVIEPVSGGADRASGVTVPALGRYRRAGLLVLVWALALCYSVVRAGPAFAAADSRQDSGRSVALQWVGDIALSTQRGLPPGALARALAPVRGLLRDADLTAGNLEGTLSVGGFSKCGSMGTANCFAFQAPPSTAAALRSLGFGLVNQANNHSMDFGPSGRAQTLSALDRAGVAHTGLPGEITLVRACTGCESPSWGAGDARRAGPCPRRALVLGGLVKRPTAS